MSCITIEKESYRSFSMDHFNILMNLAARGKTPVLLIGEYGSGRSHTAALIHNLSSHTNNSFRHFQCLSFQSEQSGKSQLEKQLRRAMLKAKGGTLFLDKLDQLAPAQLDYLIGYFNKIFKRHGVNSEFESVNVKIIASIGVKTFDRLPTDPIWISYIDLLNPFILHQPPLRDRLEDIPILIDAFLMEFKHRNPQLEINEFSESTLYRCLFYDWPGNIRQLKNVVIYSALIAPGTTVYPDDLPPYLQRSTYQYWLSGTHPVQNLSFITAEKNFINHLLGKTGSIQEVSRLLEISFPKLQLKIETYNLSMKSNNYIN